MTVLLAVPNPFAISTGKPGNISDFEPYGQSAERFSIWRMNVPVEYDIGGCLGWAKVRVIK
ncbi:hypothetical protein BSPA111_35290 [Buttiauxella sp. A111]|nr:hypothetical protein BSPA111_35290 [Buttiauxella sp. A111]